jgi:hypothetical protein
MMAVAQIPFVVEEGLHSEATAVYLPYGTRTLRFAVRNQTGRPLKLWLRPDSTPAGYPASLIYGCCDEDDDLWIHWAGGMERGAAVKTKEKSPLEDRSLKVWEVKPVEVAPGESRAVFLNVTHHGGLVRARRLTLRVVTAEGEEERPLDTSLRLRLEPPLSEAGAVVGDPVRGVWDESGGRLVFVGSQLPDYVSRWWLEEEIVYRDAGPLPGLLSLELDNAALTARLDAGRPVTLATVVDNDWWPGQDVHRLRPTMAELYHFCDRRYYALRLWFLWLDKRIGSTHEVPDAERVDIVFDRLLEPEPVCALGTDFHYQETWGRLRPGQTVGQVQLGVALNSLSAFVATQFGHFLRQSRTANPARSVARQLCGAVSWQTGPQAHVPLLANVNWLRHITSGDVRQG